MILSKNTHIYTITNHYQLKPTLTNTNKGFVINFIMNDDGIAKFNDNCKKLLEQDQIRFAGILDHMGNLISGGMKEGLTALEPEEEQRNMFMQVVLRVMTRTEFDDSLGSVLYSASRRQKVVVLSFGLPENYLLLVSAESDINIDEMANKILEII